MIFKMALGLVALAAMAGCADRFPAPTAAEVERIEIRAATCMAAKVVELDDTLSNARTVGKSVVQACRPDLQQLLYTMTRNQGPAYARGYEEGFWPDMVEQATVEVLRARSAAKR